MNLTVVDPRASLRHGHPGNATSSRRVVVLANRAPLRHGVDATGVLRASRSASGLVTAIEPVVARAGGIWVAHGEGPDIAAADPHGHVIVEAGSDRYDIRYVPIEAGEYARFYGGFANEALWPLCHSARVSPAFRPADFTAYAAANRRFARAVAQEAGTAGAVVLVQDYHFALAPRLIRDLSPSSSISTFWHIPWPEARLLDTCPWARRLVEGLLGSDVVGVQTEDDVRRFLEAVTLLVGADVDTRHRQVEIGGRTVLVRACPVGVEWDSAMSRTLPDASSCRETVFSELSMRPDTQIVVGVDRMDYTKGIVEKLSAYELLLERRSDLRGRLVLVQVAEPSRTSLDAYRAERTRAADTAARINARFGTDEYQPVQLLERHFEADEVYRLYRAADVCWVNSLDDGMNLVAKEFVAARDDERGVLLLSERAGASRQLRDALVVNPFAVERSARTLERALHMPKDEQARRMRALRSIVATTDTTWWTRRLFSDLADATVRNARPLAAIASSERTRHAEGPGPRAAL